MSHALHDFLVHQLGIDSARTTIVMDNASTLANANRNILCSALEKIQQSKSVNDFAPHSPRRTLSKLRLPGSPHASAFEQTRSPIRNNTTLTVLAQTKSPSRWETSVALEGMRSRSPRQPKRILSSHDMLRLSCTPPASSSCRKLSFVARIGALPLLESDDVEDHEETDTCIENTPTSSPSPICVRDFGSRQASDDDLLSKLTSSIDDFAIFED